MIHENNFLRELLSLSILHQISYNLFLSQMLAIFCCRNEVVRLPSSAHQQPHVPLSFLPSSFSRTLVLLVLYY